MLDLLLRDGGRRTFGEGARCRERGQVVPAVDDAIGVGGETEGRSRARESDGVQASSEAPRSEEGIFVFAGRVPCRFIFTFDCSLT